MSIFHNDDFARQGVRTTQMIVGALVMGLLSFAAVAIVVRLTNARPGNGGDNVLPYIAVAFTVATLIARVIVASSTTSSGRARLAAGKFDAGSQPMPADATDAERLLGLHRGVTIIEAALCEGPAFFVLIAFIVTGHWWLLAVVAVLLGLLVMLFPTFDRVENWVRQQLELMEYEKSRG